MEFGHFETPVGAAGGVSKPSWGSALPGCRWHESALSREPHLHGIADDEPQAVLFRTRGNGRVFLRNQLNLDSQFLRYLLTFQKARSVLDSHLAYLG